MKHSIEDQKLLKEIQARTEKKMRENEISVIEYWKEKVEKIQKMKPEGIAPLLLELKKLSSMMENRISILKKGRS
ncbi:MAG: hypothetical protein M0P57_12905 [Syntrophales bacterium]|nr:hypothetical protein [Syntrophales bacterium]MDY0043469.1 hypothetical protein [Syntrophales bacterium]